MDMESKIIRFSDETPWLQKFGRPLVFTNGVFDVLHPGHVTYLARARQLGTSLLVAVNGDQSARMLGKGPDRPINNESDRAFMVAALQSVNWVTIFDEQTPCRLIEILKPDVYVKGGDYDIDSLEETALVKSWGGAAYALPFVTGYSTTNIVSRIRANE
jgi:D-glycero-beta-D-manno-heptose 1-phosphate adenylyltransferase